MGVTGLETAFAVLYTRPRAARACSTLDAAGRADDGGRRRPTACAPPALAKGAPANLCLVDLDAALDGGRGRLRERARTTPASPGASCSGRVLMTLAAGVGRLPRARLRDPARGRPAACAPGSAREARPLARRAGRGRRAGGVPARPCSTSTGWRRNVAVLVQGARVLGLPVLVTEQYPKGLGRTVPEVAEHLDGVEPIEKVCFSAVAGGRLLARARRTSAATRCCCAASRPTCA